MSSFDTLTVIAPKGATKHDLRGAAYGEIIGRVPADDSHVPRHSLTLESLLKFKTVEGFPYSGGLHFQLSEGENVADAAVKTGKGA